MPKNDSYSQGVQTPVLGDSPDIEVALSTLAAGIVPKTIMRFADANARAAALTGTTKPVPGMVTYLIAEDRYDGRMGDGTWQALTPGNWQPITTNTGVAAQSGSPGYRVINGIVHLRGRFRRTNNGQFATGTDWSIATLPSAIRPETDQYWVTPVEIGAGIYYGRTQLNYDTGLIIVQTPPGATSTSNGLHWTGIDGLSYSL
ncbi:hypothetical protein [Streptomyces sp. NPDC005302]|uniref:hypothetical protein n=1 Tax=Streptomyces sp. NPDC005302 TaxID=3154675 RepID=UPI0033A25E2C